MPVVPDGGMSWDDFEPVTPEKKGFSFSSAYLLNLGPSWVMKVAREVTHY